MFKSHTITMFQTEVADAAWLPYAANLLENITKRNLRVDRIVPLHGTIAPFSDLVKTQAKTTTD